MPKMAQYIFRTRPARSQAYLAEELEKEGWFAGEGWTIAGWFDDIAPDQIVIVGKNRFDAKEVWRKSHRMFIEYGKKNALSREERMAWANKAVQLSTKKDPESLRALQAVAQTLHWIDSYHAMTNYLGFLDQTDAEGHDETVAARQKFYLADRLRQDNDIRALAVYREALDDWIDVMARFPTFGRQQDIQEDSYEAELNYLRLLMKQKQRQLDPLVKAASNTLVPLGFEGAILGAAQVFNWPDNVPSSFKGTKLRQAVPTRTARGPLDRTFVYVGTEKQKNFLEKMLLGTAQAGIWPRTLPVEKLLLDETNPFRGKWVKEAKGQQEEFKPAKNLLAQRYKRQLLTAQTWHQVPPGPDWQPLLDASVGPAVRERLGWTLPATTALPTPKTPPPPQKLPGS
jgi:hypothetical protein